MDGEQPIGAEQGSCLTDSDYTKNPTPQFQGAGCELGGALNCSGKCSLANTLILAL